MKIILLVIFFILVSKAGQEVGNGGDVVECRQSQQNTLRGLYSIDYLLTFQDSNQNNDIIKVKSLSESFFRIRKNIAKMLPEFLSSFDEFIQHIGNKNFYHKYIWEEASFGLVDIKDEQIVTLLPENCKTGKTNQLIQAIIRLNSLNNGSINKVYYKYVPSIINRITVENPTQLSFLYIHEWLWEISHNVENNRRLNRFFHSIAFDQLSRYQITSLMNAAGIKIPKQIVPRIFNNSICQPDVNAAQKLLNFVNSKTDFNFKAYFFSRVVNCEIDQQSCVIGDLKEYKYSPGVDQEMYYSLKNGKPNFYFKVSGKTDYVAFECSLDLKSAFFSCYAKDYALDSSYFVIDQFGRPQEMFGSIGKNGCIQFYLPYTRISSSSITKREYVIWSKIKY